MTWQDRLRDSIKLVSPTGKEFAPAWVGNPRTLEKSLGLFKYPKLVGEIVQDLDTAGTQYPLTLHFEGPENDIEAGKFFEACRERGTWVVTHPVHGQLRLQLISVTENVQPVTSGNITVVETEWMEPITDEALPSASEWTARAARQAQALNEKAVVQFADIVKLENASDITTLKTSVGKAVTLVKLATAPLTQLAAEVTAAVRSVERGIIQSLDEEFIDLLSLGKQMQTLVNLPAAVETNAIAKVVSYGAMLQDLVTLNINLPTGANIGAIAVQELMMVAGLAATSQSTVLGELQSRVEALTLLRANVDAFDLVTNTLDQTQDLYQDNPIDIQYFSQSQTFNDATFSAATTISMLLRRSFDLAAAKFFVLDRNRAPVEIAASEYGDMDHFDFFIQTNELKADDIILLPFGREVVVYL